MLMSDVIKVLGSTPLKEFPWGHVVRDTVNLFVEVANRLTDESTGEDVTLALDTLSDDTRVLVLRANIDHTRAVVPVAAGGSPVLDDDAAILDDEVALRRTLMSPTFMVVVSLVLVPLAMAIYMVSTLSTHSTFEWLEFFKSALSFFRSVMEE